MTGHGKATSSQGPSRHDYLDVVRLNRLYGDKPSVLQAMEQEYAKRSRELLQTLRSAEQSLDYQALEEAAHALKGNSSLIGALRVESLAQDIQAAARNREEQAIRAGLQELEPALERTITLLEDFLHG